MNANIEQAVKEATKRPKRKMFDFELEQAYGKEPCWDGVSNTDADFSSKFLDALNWANFVLDREEYKQEVFEYLISKDKPVEQLENIQPWRFMEAGKLAWLYNNGCPLTEKLMLRLESKIAELYQVSEPEEDIVLTDSGEVLVEEAKPKMTRSELKAQLHTRKIEELTSLVDDVIDQSVINSSEMDSSAVYRKFSTDSVDTKIAIEISDKLHNKHQVLLKELDSLQNMDEEERIAQFDSLDNFERYASDIESNLNACINAINQLSSYLGNKKALKKSERKIGKYKAKRIENQLAKMNFKVQDDTYKVMSINPVSVVGAMTLLAFNTNTRKISIYTAKDEAGLDVKGTTIQNYDESNSVQKILKKPDMLKQFQEGNIRRVKILFKDNIRAKESPVNGRMNEHTILLKVFKEKYPTE